MKDQKLMKYILVRVAMLVGLAIIILLFSGPSFKLTPVSSFQIPELKGRNASLAAFQDVLVTVSDSMIYMVDCKDSLNTNSYCYSLTGKRNDSYKLTLVKQDTEPFIFTYLYDLSQIALAYWNKGWMDFYSTQGIYLGRKDVLQGRTGFLNIAEYHKNLYYVIYSNFKHIKITTTELYEAKPGQDMRLIKKSVKSPRAALWAPIQIDSDENNNLAILEPDWNYYYMTIYHDSQVIKSKIKRNRDILPWAMKDNECHFLTGKDFVSIGVMGKDIMPLREQIYDFKGRYLGTLNLKKMLNAQLVDISDNNLICFDPKTATIRIYKLELKKWFGLM
jgi:hypothetical protein